MATYYTENTPYSVAPSGGDFEAETPADLEAMRDKIMVLCRATGVKEDMKVGFSESSLKKLLKMLNEGSLPVLLEDSVFMSHLWGLVVAQYDLPIKVWRDAVREVAAKIFAQ